MGKTMVSCNFSLKPIIKITMFSYIALISKGLSPSIVHEGPMPLIQLLLVLVPQDTFLLFEIPSAITLQVVATWVGS